MHENRCPVEIAHNHTPAQKNLGICVFMVATYIILIYAHTLITLISTSYSINIRALDMNRHLSNSVYIVWRIQRNAAVALLIRQDNCKKKRRKNNLQEHQISFQAYKQSTAPLFF